jgi:hypothetical protein
MQPAELCRSVFLSGVGIFVSIVCNAADDEALQRELSQPAARITLAKKSYSLASKVDIPAEKQVDANGAEFVFEKPVKNQWCVTLHSGSSLKNLEIRGAEPSASYDFTQHGMEVYAKYNFNYTPDFHVVWLEGDNISLSAITIRGCTVGIAGNAREVSISESAIQAAYACTNLYKSSGIRVANSVFYGGSFGCLTFPSCRDITVERCKLYNPKSTGVNPGGATLEILNARKIDVRWNYVIAGDCINLENGALDAVIADNIVFCAPLINKATNGVGIGVQAHDLQAGTIGNITITRNKIAAFEKIKYGSGIRVGNVNGNTVDNIRITNNTITGANEGIQIENRKQFMADQVAIENNNIECHSFGIRLINVSEGKVLGNRLSAYKAVWNDSLWGIQIHNCSQLLLDRNRTTGFTKHYYQSAAAKGVEIRNPTVKKGEVTKQWSTLFIVPAVEKDEEKALLKSAGTSERE